MRNRKPLLASLAVPLSGDNKPILASPSPLAGEGGLKGRVRGVKNHNLRILTFNWHEPYIHMLAETGHIFDVVEPYIGRGVTRRWDLSVRPLPENTRLISWTEASERLRARLYNLALCHNFADLALTNGFPVRSALLFHNSLTGELAIGGNTIPRDEYLASVTPLARTACKIVYVSQSKKDDWGFEGSVIPHGVNVSRFGPYTGNILKALRIGNLIRERGGMLGFDLQERILDGFANTLLGHNPTIPHSVRPHCFGWFKNILASHRLYLNTTTAPYEDAFNLSALEAMASGAPAVSSAHPGSFIEDGVNGFISGDLDALRGRVSALLTDRRQARRIGKRGRQTVAELFPMDGFIAGWNGVFESVAA